MGIRKPGGHDLGSGSHEVVGNVPQRVGDLDGSHVTIVEEDEIQLHASAADTLGQSSDVGAGIGRSTAEPPGEGTVGGGILPIFLLGNARTVGSPGRGTPGGQPSHAVAADGHGETVGGRETAHVVEHRSDTLGGGDVGRGGITFLPHPNAAPLIGAQLEQGSSRMGIHVKDQQPLVVQSPLRDDALHVLDILLGIGRKVLRPREIHEHGPPDRTLRSFDLVAGTSRANSKGQQQEKQATNHLYSRGLRLLNCQVRSRL